MKSFKFNYSVLLLSILILVPCISMGYNWGQLVNDGSFESGGLTNWVTSGSVSIIVGGAEDGSDCAEFLSAGASIQQTITTPSGQSGYYTGMGIWVKNTTTSTLATITCLVFDNGNNQTTSFSLPAGGSSAPWTNFIFFHVLSSSSDFTIKFSSPISGVFIDNINVNSVPNNGSFESDVQGATNGGGPVANGQVPNDGLPDFWQIAYQMWHFSARGTDPVPFFTAHRSCTTDLFVPSGTSQDVVDGTHSGVLSFSGLLPGNNSVAPINEFSSWYQTTNDVRQGYGTVPSTATPTIYATLWSEYGSCSAIVRIGNSWSSYADKTTLITTTPTQYSQQGPQVSSSNASPGAWIQIMAITPNKPVYVDNVRLAVTTP